MKKIFLKYNQTLNSYNIFENSFNRNDELYFIERALDPVEYLDVKVEVNEHSVIIWANDSIKKIANIECKSMQEWSAFNDIYDQYYDKRWDEIPTVELILSDWEELQKKWKKIKEDKPPYIIFVLNDSEEFDKVDIISKNELSQQDLQYIQYEHEKYLAWKKAEKLYNYDHEIIDDIWRIPADSVYNADIEKYLGRDVGFVQHKKYTKLEAIAEFKERLQKGEPVYLVVHWLFVCSLYNIALLDLEKDPFLWDISLMDSNPTDMSRSREQLIEMADRVLAGQRVEIYSRD